MSGETPKPARRGLVDEFEYDGVVFCYHGWRAAKRLAVDGVNPPKRYFRCRMYEYDNDNGCGFHMDWDELMFAGFSESDDEDNTEETVKK
ncbi:unnamed protein product [Linum tenue]|uniref:Uncharacterized protein n=1 Tax=Linum tenue TaxID=586396 RepID=A0AAV0S4F2_9ROSI|nr:unnamed protein product [Linum tenue]